MIHLAPTLLLVAFLQSPPDDPFSKLSLPDALGRAKEEGKVVMVDFFTTWCAPCKKLDLETWTDADVRAWLREHTVALKLDAEKEKAAAGYRVRGYPTMLFLRPEGTEIGRLVGFRDAEAFLEQAADLLAGKSPLDQAREKVEAGGENDPMLRQDLGEELARVGRDAEALAEFLWCWDHGLEHSRSFVGVRGSFLLGDIVDLGQSHPPAVEALKQRRDACEKSLLGGSVTYELAADLSNLNRALGDAAATLRVYDALRAREDFGPRERHALRIGMFDEVAALLLAAKRYEDVLEGVGDYDAVVDQKIGVHELSMAMIEADAEMRASFKQRVVADGATYYEALLGVKRVEDARALAERLIAFAPVKASHDRLAGHARAAGAEEEAASLEQRAVEAPLEEAEKPRQQSDDKAPIVE